MDWLLNAPQVYSQFAQLGSMHGNTFVIGDNVLATLQDIYSNLFYEDQTLRTFRRTIGFGQIVRKHLIPLLIHTKDEEITDMVIRLMVNLTLPVECLYKIDVMKRTEAGRHTISDCHLLLAGCKQAFSENSAIKSIVDYLKNILEKHPTMSLAQCDSVNNCLLLIRNILHIPEDICFGDNRKNDSQIQNQIVWTLFTLSIDKLLIHLMTCTQRAFFGLSIVQLIALVYKDQHVGHLQKLINVWFESSTTSDSSEDYESNTTVGKEGSQDSSPILTSDSSDSGGQSNNTNVDRRHNDSNALTLPQTKSAYEVTGKFNTDVKNHSMKTSDKDTKSNKSSKDNDAENNRKSEILSSTIKHLSSPNSELSDCGYVTQVENPESFSTSSNEDDNGPRPHQKPPCNQKNRFNATNNTRNTNTGQDKKDYRRKKLIKRSKTSLINIKGSFHHTPTDEDISHILKEFTVDFLLKGYGYLVKEVHAQLMMQSECQTIQIDTSHFFWLITYFLKFTINLELDLELVKPVLCYDIISYLTYEGVMLSEELDLSTQQDCADIKSYLRRLHLLVTAIKEFLHVLDSYKKLPHLSLEDKEYIHLLLLQVGATTNLQCLFVLLLRRYSPSLHSIKYLEDLIVTNHMLLLQLDEASKFPDFKGNTNIMEHIKQFASVEIMNQYGILLADFKKNGEFVNDCIFTMMHHICGDIEQAPLLLQPLILKSFFQMFEQEYELCDDWSDLIEYIMHKFINTPSNRSLTTPRSSAEMNNLLSRGNEDSVCITDHWSKEERDNLYWFYVQSKNSKDIVGEILRLFEEGQFKQKSRINIIQQLFHEDIISVGKYDELMKFEDTKIDSRRHLASSPNSSIAESGIGIEDEKELDDIQILKEQILTENKGNLILWLQKALINCCFVKLKLTSAAQTGLKNLFTDQNVMEPVAYHCVLKRQSVPVVSWNIEQSIVLLYQPFMLLLHKLGFYLPADTGKMFVRIPEFWTADVLYNNAEKLGPLDKSILKFDLAELSGIHSGPTITTAVRRKKLFAVHGINKFPTTIRFIPDPSTLSFCPPPESWIQIVKYSKLKLINDRDPSIPTATITSTSITTATINSNI